MLDKIIPRFLPMDKIAPLKLIKKGAWNGVEWGTTHEEFYVSLLKKLT